MITNLVVPVLATLVAFLLNAILEWFIHGPVMHGGLATEYLRKSHQEHHGFYEDGRYRNTDHGHHVHLPWWSMLITVGFLGGIGLVLAKLTGFASVFWAFVLVSVAYYHAYQYIHTLMHIPITNRFDRAVISTRIFKRLNAHHRVHHLESSAKPWGKMVNISLLCTLGDHLFGTKFRGAKG